MDPVEAAPLQSHHQAVDIRTIVPPSGHQQQRNEKLMPKYLLQQLVEPLGLDAVPEGDIRIEGVATLEDAGPGQLAYAESDKLLKQVKATRAAAVLVPSDFPEVSGRLLLPVENPRRAFLQVAELFVERLGCDGIHKTQVSIRMRSWGRASRSAPAL